MRLTLRTLLAYLDDILEPAQAKEIGDKLQDSPVANSLSNRIREVLRRRRLTAPQVDGGDVDANTVAEYLDNTLPPEAVADIERVCLESDIHLAEVAGCHQILTLVLGEPVEIVPQSRERMYALGPPPKPAVETAAAAATVAAPTAPLPQREAARPAPAAQPSFADTIPDYLKPRPLWQRLVPYFAILLVGGLWLLMLSRDSSFWPGLLGAANSPAPAAPQVAANEVPAESPEMAADQQPIEQFEPAGVEPLPEKPLDVDPMPPPDAPEELPPKKPAAKEVAIVDEPVPVERPAQAPIKTKPAPPSVAAPAAEPPEPAENIAAPTVEAPPAQYTSTDGVLLRFDARDAGWYVMPRRSLIHPGEKLAVPEPYEAVIQFGIDRSLLKLLPATVIERLGPTAAAPFGIAVERGRVHFLSGTAPEGQPFAGTTVAVAVRGELWRVELLTPRSVCGVEIVPREPSALDENFGKNSYTGGLYVAQGSVRFADGADRVLVLEGPAWVPLNPELRAAEGGAMVAPLSSIPDWLSDKKAPLTVNNYGKLFEKEFDFDEPVDVSLTNAVKDRKPEISRLAVACLGLTGDHAGMLQALDRSEHEESRLAAIHGLRTWLVLDPQHAVTLKSDLNRHFHPDEAEAAYRLLWGFNEADARDPDASNELVTRLSSESLAIRELAFFNVQRLTGRRYDYRPNGIPAHRKSAVNQWLRHLEKDGALLPPNGKAPSADRGAFSTLRSTSRS